MVRFPVGPGDVGFVLGALGELHSAGQEPGQGLLLLINLKPVRRIVIGSHVN